MLIIGLVRSIEWGEPYAAEATTPAPQRTTRPNGAHGPGRSHAAPMATGPMNVLARQASFSTNRARTGAVTLIQRFGGALNLMKQPQYLRCASD
jgi:hypothetical protein